MTTKRKILAPRSMVFVFLTLAWGSDFGQAAESLGPEEALKKAYAANPEIAAFEARATAEEESVSLRYAPANPRVGLMREAQMNLMQQQMGPMTSWSVTQEIMFPTKYFTMASAQKARSEAVRQEFQDKKLEIRERTLSTFYGFYSASRIVALLEAQRETLREIARIAEIRRATGAVPQQDEMKAHVEQTRLENELLLQKQEVVELQSQLNALLNEDASREISVAERDLQTPVLTAQAQEIDQAASTGSNLVASQQFMAEEAQRESSLAKQGYLPDFMLSFRKPFTNSPPGAFSASIELSIPLWFFARQTSEVSAASARALEAEKNLELAKRNTLADVRSTRSRVETFSKLLKIYETALIPQATTTLNSSRAAYSAGRVGFQELLDSERSLYAVRIDYYRTLAKFIESLTRLERLAGSSLSSLPWGDGEKS